MTQMLNCRTALAIGCILATVCGCQRTPRLILDRSPQLPQPRPDPTHKFRTVEPEDLGEKVWVDLHQDLGTPGGRIVPTAESKRWSSVKVYFAYDSAAIGPAERPKLEKLSQHLMQHPSYSVVVEGHCDERGSDEYNRALGETRALSVRDYLITLGINGNRIETVSYGEDRPAVGTANSESEHRENRRAEFVIGIRQ